MSNVGPIRSSPRLGVRARIARAGALALVALVLAAPRAARAQDGGVVAGTVVTEAGSRPLVGVQVAVQDQAGKGAVTDGNGRFRITGLTGTEVIVNVRMIGYRAMNRMVRVGSTDVRFAMSERAVELDQIVVTGTAGDQQKRAIGNSIAKVDAASVVATAAVPSVEDLINGRAPGVVVMPGTGMVGSGSRIRIRGMSTFSLSSDPLIYVDGVRVNNETGSGLAVQAFSSGVVSRINDFDPEEIESIEILKGPAAATLYGTEAARGVINIITKKGTAGGNQYAFTVKGGQQMFWNYENRVPTNYWRNPSTGLVESIQVAQQELARGTPIFRKGAIHDYAGNASGGTGVLRYFVSGETNENQGADPTNSRQQFSGRTNLQITPSQKVDIQTSLGYINSNTQLSCEAGCGGATWESWYSNPQNSPTNLCAAQNNAYGCNFVRGFQSAPPEADRAFSDWQRINRMTGSAAINFRPFPWMSHRLTVGTDFGQEKNEELLPYLTNDTIAFFWTNTTGYKYQNRREVVLNTYDYVGSINHDLTSKINSTTSFGTQYYQKHISWITGEGDFFPAPGLQTISSAAQKPVTSDNYQNNNTLGYYGQEQIGWQDRLFLTAAVRVDNNSSFGKDVKWVTYPKASLSWVLTEEPTVKERLPSFINTFKLRAAYGQSGEQPDIYTALRTFAPVPGPNGTPALTPQFLGNPSLGPERGIETETGFESSFLQDRLGLDFTYYHTRTKNAILRRGVAPSTGFGDTTQFVNAGAILNQGLEALFKADVITRQSWGVSANVNLSHNWAKVEKLSGTDTTIVNGSIQQRIGYAPWSWFQTRVVSATFDPVTKRAINAMCDDAKGGVTPCFNANGAVIAPRVYQGRAIPATEGSLSTNIRFLSRFHFNGLVDFKAGYKKVDNNIRIRCQIFNTCLDRIYPETVDPKVLAGEQTSGTIVDWVIKDSKFAKLRELSLTYDAPEKYVSHIGARGATLNLAARNIHTWTPYTGLDPENYFLSGTPNFTDQAELPQLTSFIFTVHLSY
jgi:TonB-linked SusC/RagA family outer membrane protein